MLDLRLYALGDASQIEKVVVMRIWVSMSCPEVQESAAALQSFLDTVLRNVKGPFSAEATHAAQMVCSPIVYLCIILIFGS